MADFLVNIRWLVVLATLLCWSQAGQAAAHPGPVSVLMPPEESLGRYLRAYQENEPLSLEAIRALAGEMLPVNEPVPALGIGAAPVWFHLAVDNPTDSPRQAMLVIGAAWIDRIDVHITGPSGDGMAGGQTVHQIGGDREKDFIRPAPGVGYPFAHQFPPGRSDVFIRAETPDPMLLPIRLISGEQFARSVRAAQYSYGLLYGFLLALCAYNLMLFAGIGQRSHLHYSLYLASFIALNLAYSGHGFAWFWPQGHVFQQYIILVLMAVFACAGFRFARTFLGLAELAPWLDRAVRLLCLAVMASMALAVAIGAQSLAALLAFAFALFFTLAMVGLGYYAILHQRSAGKYFLAAVISGMVGAAVTTVTVWGWIPYHPLGFRAVEIGIVIEATLLALAVAYLVRQHEKARHRAESLARTDPLTGLMNRRSFMEQGEGLWNSAQRHKRPLALVLFDLDYFKRINDQHGHAAGDKVLVEVANLIRRECRLGDLPARWGGEEFVVLLPEATLVQARRIAERLRQQFAVHRDWAAGLPIKVCASFGVVERTGEVSLEKLIEEADFWLYRAKREGRDRICGPWMSPVSE